MVRSLNGILKNNCPYQSRENVDNVNMKPEETLSSMSSKAKA